MPFLLNDKIPIFPPPYRAAPDGLLAVGGSVSPAFLEAAYRLGIFPWYNAHDPVLWWSPPERPVFLPGRVRVHKSMRQWMRRRPGFRLTFDKAFDRVVELCASVPRKGQEGTWLHPELQVSMKTLHRRGKAHSVEVWDDQGRLVGGLYGVDAGPEGKLFSGDSMFSLVPNASKLALIHLVKNLDQYGYEAVDGQVVSPHLLRMGARVFPRDEFLDRFIYRIL
ncbi:MAG: leucyl/phenylalanyl-tRNA--protein transferase [Chlorobi bacterium]|nr:leucyl/phenylalanyl-tRNA--protein transferase [Chlorobiota bacterium]